MLTRGPPFSVAMAGCAGVSTSRLDPGSGLMQEVPTNASVKDFHGLPLPEGVDRRNLYHSPYRTIATYAMQLSELDEEFRKVIKRSSAIVKDDRRRNLEGHRA